VNETVDKVTHSEITACRESTGVLANRFESWQGIEKSVEIGLFKQSSRLNYYDNNQ
jgi:hypothetical protein